MSLVNTVSQKRNKLKNLLRQGISDDSAKKHEHYSGIGSSQIDAVAMTAIRHRLISISIDSLTTLNVVKVIKLSTHNNTNKLYDIITIIIL